MRKIQTQTRKRQKEPDQIFGSEVEIKYEYATQEDWRGIFKTEQHKGWKITENRTII